MGFKHSKGRLERLAKVLFTPSPEAADAASPVPNEQRNVLRVLVAAQIFSGAGIAAGVTVGALLAEEMLGTTTLAGIPSALFTGGSAAAAVLIGRISGKRGRRPGLATGYALGALGSAAVVFSAILDNPVLLFMSLFIYGSGTATNLQARYSGADLATPNYRAQAISTVLVVTTLGGVVGPNLASPMQGVAELIGIPKYAGPFILSGFAYGAAAAVIGMFLKPDPLLRAKELAAAGETRLEVPSVSTSASDSGLDDNGEPIVDPSIRHGLFVGAMVLVLSQLVMVAIMTMTPVHMKDHGHATSATGLVIALHVAGMYLPSPISGRLTDRLGRTTMAVASGVTLLVSGIVAALAPAESVPLIAFALFLLGLGWNFGVVSGTAIITDNVPLATRAKKQSSVDVAIALAGASGGLVSGVVMSLSNYAALGLAGGFLALAMVPVVFRMANKLRGVALASS